MMEHSNAVHLLLAFSSFYTAFFLEKGKESVALLVACP